ncbi:MAG: hypothetical protein WC936_07040 [Candidatus Nanoarchaeia archaeon]|jgi:hypothetical protein
MSRPFGIFGETSVAHLTIKSHPTIELKEPVEIDIRYSGGDGYWFIDAKSGWKPFVDGDESGESDEIIAFGDETLSEALESLSDWLKSCGWYDWKEAPQ